MKLSVIIISPTKFNSFFCKALFFLAFALSTSALYSQAFTTTWEVPENDKHIEITVNTGNYNYNYTINWGDGTVQNNQTDNATHTYTSAGTYTVEITGTFPTILMNNSADKSKLISIEQWGNIAWQSMNSSFRDCNNLVISDNAGSPDLSNVTDASDMFRASGITATGNLNSWDVSNITDMYQMFNRAGSFNGDISAWNTAKVTNMSYMFTGATSFDQDISRWDLSSIPDDSNVLRNMFEAASLSPENYDALLIRWSIDDSVNPNDNIDDIPQNIIFDAGDSKYCSSEAVTARTVLRDTYGWTITDGGQAQDCFEPFILTFDTSFGTGGTTITLPIVSGSYDVDTNNDAVFELTDQSGTQTIDLGTSGCLLYTSPSPRD